MSLFYEDLRQFLAREEDTDTRQLLDAIWDVYGRWTAGQLSAKTHEKDSPWSKIMKENPYELLRGTDIGVALLRKHFSQLAENS